MDSPFTGETYHAASVVQHGKWRPRNVAMGQKLPCQPRNPISALHPIVLQKSKVAAALIFGENLKREDIGDSYGLSRATEVAYEFSV
jgi:hypothetical protein